MTKLSKEIQEGLYDPRRESAYNVYLKGKKYGTVKAKTLDEAKRKAWMALGISYKVEVTPTKKEKHFRKARSYDSKKSHMWKLTEYEKGYSVYTKENKAIRIIRVKPYSNETDVDEWNNKSGDWKRVFRGTRNEAIGYLKKIIKKTPVFYSYDSTAKFDKVRGYDPKISALLPTRWYAAMVKGIKKSSDVRNPYAIVKNIWAKLSPSKKAEIVSREAKGERFRYDLPLPVDKPTRGIGTVRMVKPFKLAEVQVNLSVADYLTALKSGIFSRMKRQDGTTALVARCKSPEKNVNIFVDKAGK